MFLPNQLELQTLFSGFLFEAGLSAISVKNYLSDLRHFLSFCLSISNHDNPPTVQEVFQSITKYIDLYTNDQKNPLHPKALSIVVFPLSDASPPSSHLNSVFPKIKLPLQHCQPKSSPPPIFPKITPMTHFRPSERFLTILSVF